MAVVVQCFQCNAVLDLDDGFRGGVCRCSGCGTLLQVPKGEPDGSKRGGTRKRRPAGPPGPGANSGTESSQGVSATPRSANGRSANSAALPPDPGPSSSTLRGIQQARPVENVPNKSGAEATAVLTTGSVAASAPATSTAAPATVAPATPAPGLSSLAPRPFPGAGGNNGLLWVAIAGLFLIAIGVAALVIAHIFGASAPGG